MIGTVANTTRPSRLSRIVTNLSRAPKVDLSALRALSITLRPNKVLGRGLGEFLKCELPRIAYAIPKCAIHVGEEYDKGHSSMDVVMARKRTRTIGLFGRSLPSIMDELMAITQNEQEIDSQHLPTAELRVSSARSQVNIGSTPAALAAASAQKNASLRGKARKAWARSRRWNML